jgi:hypothetical protein
MGILYCMGSNFKEISEKFAVNEYVEYVDFDYDNEDTDGEVLYVLKGLDKERLGVNLRFLLSVDPYEDTIIDFDVVRNAYEELKLQINIFQDKPYYNFLENLLILLSKCVECRSMIIAIGD